LNLYIIILMVVLVKLLLDMNIIYLLILQYHIVLL